MKTNPTAFIEQVNKEGEIKSFSVYPISQLDWSLDVTYRSHDIETIAVFKIYPHPKPVIAQTTIIE